MQQHIFFVDQYLMNYFIPNFFSYGLPVRGTLKIEEKSTFNANFAAKVLSLLDIGVKNTKEVLEKVSLEYERTSFHRALSLVSEMSSSKLALSYSDALQAEQKCGSLEFLLFEGYVCVHKLEKDIVIGDVTVYEDNLSNKIIGRHVLRFNCDNKITINRAGGYCRNLFLLTHWADGFSSTNKPPFSMCDVAIAFSNEIIAVDC